MNISMIDKNKIIALAEERIKALDSGCYLVDVNVTETNKITVEVDNENRGVSIEECVSISRNIEHNLDREEEDFELQVTSPGLDKPFKVEKQYLKNIGKMVAVQTNDDKSYEGILKEVNENEIVLAEKKSKNKQEKTYNINKENIKSTKIIISFK